MSLSAVRTQRLSPDVNLRAAEAEYDEVRSWTCLTCDTMVEEEGKHCRSCKQYWLDVESGVFEELDW
jgi:predicted adenine nucleotide alpha hydrolase (AANH) superfamily ATPase